MISIKTNRPIRPINTQDIYPKRFGFIYLSGGGDENKTAVIDSFFLRKLEGKNILFIPIAKSADRNGYKKSRIWLSNKLNAQSKDFIDVSMILELGKIRDLEKFSAVYIGGGNTYKLLHLVRESNFLPILRNYIKNGGAVYGASAGAVLMGRDISTYIEEKYTLENKKNNYTNTKGLAFIGEYSILTHFQGPDRRKLKEYFERNNNPVLAIPAGTSVMVEDNHATILGNEAVLIFEKGKPTKKIYPNQTFNLVKCDL